MHPSILLLLAEDDALIALSLEEDLKDGGFAVHHVHGGAEAIAALDEQHEHLSGLITDIRLGGDPDGWAVARKARELVANLPIVYMSGDSAHEHTAYGVPDSIMLQKPFAAAQMITAISTLLNATPLQQPI